jgi:hypothetical protein
MYAHRRPIGRRAFTLVELLVRCLGRDGLVSSGITPATRDRFELDIVLRDGIFVNQPF